MESLESRILLSGTPLEPELIQDASSVLDFSSQLSPTSGSAAQTLGAANTLTYGDRSTAWAPAQQNGAPASITVGFETPVHASGVTIRETWGNGFVTRIELLDVADTFHTIWADVDPSQPGSPVDFTVSFDPTLFATKGVRVTTDTNHNPSTREEIDSIQLHGARATGFAGPAPTVQGSIDVPGETDRYTFTLEQDRNLYFDALTNVGFTWSLTGPRGAVVSDRDFRGSDANDVGGNPLLHLVAGAYELAVDASGDQTGAYSFRLLDEANAEALTPGVPVSGLLNPGNSTRMFRFDAQAGEHFYFDMRSVASSSGSWRLFDPNGNQVWFAGISSDVDVQTLAFSGPYTLFLEGRYFVGGTNAFTFNVQRVTDDTAALTLGARVDGAIAHAGQVDRYTFTLTDERQLYFDSLMESSLDWSLRGPRGTVVSGRDFRSSDSRDFGGNPVLDLVAGDYTLTIDAAGETTGSYAFRVLDLAQGPNLTPGTPVAGVLDPASGTAVYHFTAAAGDRFFFDVQSLANNDVEWRLLSPYGDEVFEDWMGRDFAETTLNAPGVYTLLVEGRRNATGTNAFAFNVEPRGNTPPAPLTGTALLLGDVVSGSITSATQHDRYVFTLAQPALVYFDSRTDSATQWSLTGPRGSLVSGRQLRFSDSADGTSILSLVAGTYQLTIDGALGAYSFRLVDLATATPIVPGTPVTGQQLNPGNETDVYRFDVAAGQRFFFDAQQITNGDTYWRLLTPYGDQVFLTGAGSDVDVQTLSLTGTYTLLVEGRRYNTAANAYRFNVEPAIEEVRPLAIGARVDGAIAHAGEVDRYTFTMAQRSRLYFDTLSDSQVFWTLAGPTGTLVAGRNLRTSDSADNYPLLDLVAGDYTLTFDATGDDVISYAFRLLDTASAIPITPGTPVSGQLNPGSETDLYRFDVAAGERFFFDNLSFSGDAYWRLLTPYGDQVFNAFASSDVDVQTLSAPGTYFLSMEGRRYVTTPSTYRFNVQRVTDDTTAITLGTASGVDPRWTQGQLGGGLFLDGLESVQVAQGPAVDQRNNLTLELWFKADHFGNPWSNLLYKGDGGGARTYALYLNSSGYLLFSTWGGPLGLFELASPTGSVDTGRWYHAAVVADRAGGQLRMYLDGAQVASRALSATPFVATSGPLRVGRDAETSQQPFEGTVDDVRVWSVARTASQIAASKDAPLAGSETGLAVYLRLDETSGAVATDSGPSGTHGAVVNSVGGVPGAIAGRIDHPGQVDRYTFSLAQRTRLYFDTLTDSQVFWTLTGPTGTVVAGRNLRTSDSADSYPLLDLVAGDYTLTFDATGDDVVAYAFRLLDAAAAALITPGTPVSGQLSRGARRTCSASTSPPASGSSSTACRSPATPTRGSSRPTATRSSTRSGRPTSTSRRCPRRAPTSSRWRAGAAPRRPPPIGSTSNASPTTPPPSRSASRAGSIRAGRRANWVAASSSMACSPCRLPTARPSTSATTSPSSSGSRPTASAVRGATSSTRATARGPARMRCT